MFKSLCHIVIIMQQGTHLMNLRVLILIFAVFSSQRLTEDTRVIGSVYNYLGDPTIAPMGKLVSNWVVSLF